MIFTLFRGILILLIAVILTAFFSFIDKIPGSIIFEIQKKRDKIFITCFSFITFDFWVFIFLFNKSFSIFYGANRFLYGKRNCFTTFL